MTEQEWLDCTDPTPMLNCLYKKNTRWIRRLRDTVFGARPDRKRLLVNCAFCRMYWQFLYTNERKQCIETVERLIDVQPVSDFREAADWSFEAVGTVFQSHAESAHKRTLYWPEEDGANARKAFEQVKSQSCRIIRDIFGNPFRPRPVTLDPRWLSSTVLDLARTIYDERVFERLPILADALMDAGCDSETLINHCRSAGPHVRGCWVVDLLLGRV